MTVEYLSASLQAPDINGNAGVESAKTDDTDGVVLSCAAGSVELVYSPVPVDVKVVNMAGSVVALRNGLTKGIVAGDLTSGV